MSFYKQDTNYRSRDRIWQCNANQLGEFTSCCSVFTDEAPAPLKRPQSIPQHPKLCRELAVQLFCQTLPLYSYFVVWGEAPKPSECPVKVQVSVAYLAHEKFWMLWAFCIQTDWIFLVVYAFTHPLCKGLWAVRATFLKILNPKSFEGEEKEKRTNLLTTF